MTMTKRDPPGPVGTDLAGFMDGHTQFFGTKTQPHLPGQSMFDVAGPPDPAGLVETEAIAVRPADK